MNVDYAARLRSELRRVIVEHLANTNLTGEDALGALMRLLSSLVSEIRDRSVRDEIVTLVERYFRRIVESGDGPKQAAPHDDWRPWTVN